MVSFLSARFPMLFVYFQLHPQTCRLVTRNMDYLLEKLANSRLDSFIIILTLNNISTKRRNFQTP